MSEKPAHHRAPVVRITELLPHPNADTLSLVRIGGYQVVVKTADYKVGDLAVYIYPDSVVPQTEPFRFIWEPHVDPYKADGSVPDKKRRITVRRFRKEYSEGLLLPYGDIHASLHPQVGGKDAVKGYFEFGQANEGDDVSDLLGITHYDPPEPETRGENERGPQYRRWPRSLKGWFYFLVRVIFRIDLNGSVGGANEKGPKFGKPVYDVEAYKNHVDAFQPGEVVIVTEKIHGSNARFIFDGKKMYAGSRKLWKSSTSKCVWRKALEQNPWIEEWCRAHPHYTLYGEVTPTQGEKFHYGCTNGQVKFFVFDVLGPDEKWVPWGATLSLFVETSQRLGHSAFLVPTLATGPFNADEIKKLADGKSTVPGANHIREGVVIRPVVERHVHGLGRLQLKIVSNRFLEES